MSSHSTMACGHLIKPIMHSRTTKTQHTRHEFLYVPVSVRRGKEIAAIKIYPISVTRSLVQLPIHRFGLYYMDQPCRRRRRRCHGTSFSPVGPNPQNTTPFPVYAPLAMTTGTFRWWCFFRCFLLSLGVGVGDPREACVLLLVCLCYEDLKYTTQTDRKTNTNTNWISPTTPARTSRPSRVSVAIKIMRARPETRVAVVVTPFCVFFVCVCAGVCGCFRVYAYISNTICFSVSKRQATEEERRNASCVSSDFTVACWR